MSFWGVTSMGSTAVAASAAVSTSTVLTDAAAKALAAIEKLPSPARFGAASPAVAIALGAHFGAVQLPKLLGYTPEEYYSWKRRKVTGAQLLSDDFAFSIPGDPPTFDFESVPFGNTPAFRTANEGVSIRAFPHPRARGVRTAEGEYLGGSIVVEVPSSSRPRGFPAPGRIIPRGEVTRAVAIPAQHPQSRRIPAALPFPGADRKADVYVPPFVRPTVIEEPVDLDWSAVPDIPDRRWSVYIHPIPEAPAIEFRQVDKTSERTRFRAQALQHDRKPRSALAYIAALQFVNRSWQTASELLDFWQVVKANLVVYPGRQRLLVWTESVANPGYFYPVSIKRPTRLSELPFNTQNELLHDIALGDLDTWSVDWEGLAIGLYSEQLTDWGVASTRGIETSILDAYGRRGPFQYGNLTTWYERARRLGGPQ